MGNSLLRFRSPSLEPLPHEDNPHPPSIYIEYVDPIESKQGCTNNKLVNKHGLYIILKELYPKYWTL